MSTSSTNSAESPAVSGLDYDDTALTLALPGSSADDRKRAHHDEQDKPPSPKYAAFSYYLPSARCGMASGAGLPAQRAARGGRVQASEGGRGRRPLPAQGGPHRARRVRGPAPRAPRHVRPVPRLPGRRRAREQARGRGHRRRVRAHLRGQGRRLDARRRRPLEDVRRVLQADPTHEELRGRQPSSKTIFPMITRHG